MRRPLRGGVPGTDQPPQRIPDRRWDTRVGSIDLKIPKLRAGSYFPDWLLNTRTRSERAFIQVVVEAYVWGVSTRVEGLVETLDIASL